MATQRAFGFWRGLFKHGNTYEIATLDVWNGEIANFQTGRFHTFIAKCRHTKCDKECFEGRLSKAMGWTGNKAEARKKELKREREADEEASQIQTMKKSKHAWTLGLFPDRSTPRPCEFQNIKKRRRPHTHKMVPNRTQHGNIIREMAKDTKRTLDLPGSQKGKT